MNTSFQQILSSITGLTKFGGKSSGSAVGIDIGTSAIKIVEIKKKGGRAVLETYGSIALGPYAEQEAGQVTNLPVLKIAEALKEVLKQSGVTNTSVVFSIPIQSSLVFIIELPSVIKESELATIVPTEARKYIPVPITEVSLDYFILPHKEPSYEEMNAETTEPSAKKIEKTTILVVATQNDMIAKFHSIISECGLSVPFFEIEIFSSVRSCFEHELSPVLLIDIGASRTKLSIVELGTITGYHTIDRGGADITTSIAASLGIPFVEAEKMKKESGVYENNSQKTLPEIIKTHLDYIFSESNNVLLEYERKYGRTITKVIFSGGGALMKGLKEMAENNFRAEVEIGHPFSKVGAPAFLEKVLETMGPEFAVSLGLALRKLQ